MTMKEFYKNVVTKLNEVNVPYDDFNYINENSFEIHISWGDWKHEHLRADCLIFDNLGFVCVNERVDEEDGSDCYSAWRVYEKVEIEESNWDDEILWEPNVIGVIGE